ncbi:MAG: histidine--tRNA ligase [Candidatus Bathyarchaeia archaeon]
MAEFQPVRGMRDFLASEAKLMRYIERNARDIANLYGYQEIITPILEPYDLLARKAGEEIRERMYVFKDRGGRNVALRPEFTASVARLVATTLRNQPKPLRLFCVGSLYRYDEPQFGRYREFWQTNFELFGSSQPEADFEIISLTNNFLQRINLQKFSFKIGHVGVIRGILSQENIEEGQQNKIMQLLDKKKWNDALDAAKEYGVSNNCLSTLKKIFEIRGKEVNEIVSKIKKVVKDYEKASLAAENLEKILSLVEESGTKMDIFVDAGFARGLEYYTGIIFEVLVPQLDVSIGGGGRYDTLVELFGGESTPAVGIAHGVDRIMLALSELKTRFEIDEKTWVFVIPLSVETKVSAIKIANKLRNAGFHTELEVMGRGVTRALQDADRRGVTHAILVGLKELEIGKVVLRDMGKREQKLVKIEDLANELVSA